MDFHGHFHCLCWSIHAELISSSFSRNPYLYVVLNNVFCVHGQYFQCELFINHLLFLFVLGFFASRGLEERQLGPPGSPEEGDCGGAGEAADYALL